MQYDRPPRGEWSVNRGNIELKLKYVYQRLVDDRYLSLDDLCVCEYFPFSHLMISLCVNILLFLSL